MTRQAREMTPTESSGRPKAENRPKIAKTGPKRRFFGSGEAETAKCTKNTKKSNYFATEFTKPEAWAAERGREVGKWKFWSIFVHFVAGLGEAGHWKNSPGPTGAGYNKSGKAMAQNCRKMAPDGIRRAGSSPAGKWGSFGAENIKMQKISIYETAPFQTPSLSPPFYLLRAPLR